MIFSRMLLAIYYLLWPIPGAVAVFSLSWPIAHWLRHQCMMDDDWLWLTFPLGAGLAVVLGKRVRDNRTHHWVALTMGGAAIVFLLLMAWWVCANAPSPGSSGLSGLAVLIPLLVFTIWGSAAACYGLSGAVGLVLTRAPRTPSPARKCVAIEKYAAHK